MSRIHLQLGYDPLDADARDQIWNNFFEKLKKDYADEGLQIAYEYDAKEYVKKSADVKILEWNGREIRNGMSMPHSHTLDIVWSETLIDI